MEAAQAQAMAQPGDPNTEILKQMLANQQSLARSLTAMQQELKREKEQRVALEAQVAGQNFGGVGHPVIAETAPDGQVHYKLPRNMSEDEKFRRGFDDGGLLGE